jgi:hypothetical protein
MELRPYSIVIVILLICGGALSAYAHSVPADKVDAQKIFYGKPDNFDAPARVNYQKIVKATPEYSSIKKKKIVSGSAKYWILISKASDRAQRLIKKVGEETSHDLIVADGYLGTMEPPIEAKDVTELVLEKLK